MDESRDTAQAGKKCWPSLFPWCADLENRNPTAVHEREAQAGDEVQAHEVSSMPCHLKGEGSHGFVAMSH